MGWKVTEGNEELGRQMTFRCCVVYILLDVLGQIVPSTLKRQPRQETARPRPTAPRSEGSRPAEDRAAYRRAPGTGSGGPDKKADVGAGTGDVEFVSSYIY